MNANRVLFQIFFYSAFALAIGACASLPPQLRPANPSPFIGEWEGFWDSNSGSRGGLDTKIDPPNTAGRIIIHTIISNAIVPSFSIPTKLVNGELILRSTTLDMTFRLHGNDQLVAEYDNKRINDKGEWHLKRKK